MTINKTVLIKSKPFLRWTGSKRWLVKNELNKYLPKKINNYHECFLGGGAVFFSMDQSKNSFLSDSNKELIETYIEIRDDVEKVINELKKLKNTESDYYKIRSKKCKKPHTKAAKFIYLNRCSFNGIYRVNNKGIYNVPYGRRKNVDLVTENNLRAVSNRLQKVKIEHLDFEKCITNIKKNDLVFIDPPYTVAHENNGFLEYNKKIFSWKDQERLKEFINQIVELEAFFILTNASHKSILNLYENIGTIDILKRYSKVGGRNKTRGMYNELIICNTI